jgi:hypothetical protein
MIVAVHGPSRLMSPCRPVSTLPRITARLELRQYRAHTLHEATKHGIPCYQISAAAVLYGFLLMTEATWLQHKALRPPSKQPHFDVVLINEIRHAKNHSFVRELCTANDN